MFNFFKKIEESPSIIKRVGEPFKNENVELSYNSSLTIREADHLIGRKIKRVQATVNEITLILDDGSRFSVNGVTISEGKVDSLDTQVLFNTISV